MGHHLENKVAVVTGSGHGIGKAIALAMAREGAKIVTNARRREMAEATAHQIVEMGAQAVAFPCDVSSFEATRDMIDAAIANFGGIHILVNNAGAHAPRMIYNMSEEDWDKVVLSHLKGTFNCTHHACIHMRQQRWGRIVNTTSVSWLGTAGDANYSAAKAGIVGFTKAVALDMVKYGVTCNCYSPLAMTDDGGGGMMNINEIKSSYEKGYQAGFIDKREYIRGMNLPSPETVAPLVIYLCTDTATNINGRVFSIYGNEISIYSMPAEHRVIFRIGTTWTVEELSEHVPSVLLT